VALGWGLWEGPARFYFCPLIFQKADALRWLFRIRLHLWTLQRSGIIYGTKMDPSLLVLIQ